MHEVSDTDLLLSITFALSRVTFSAKERRLGENQSDRLARAVADHLKRCGWRVMNEPAPAHSVRLGLEPW